MADVEGSRGFGITGDALWVVVADPARLADWVPAGSARRLTPSPRKSGGASRKPSTGWRA